MSTKKKPCKSICSCKKIAALLFAILLVIGGVTFAIMYTKPGRDVFQIVESVETFDYTEDYSIEIGKSNLSSKFHH